MIFIHVGLQQIFKSSRVQRRSQPKNNLLKYTTADMAGHNTVIGFENWYTGSTFAVLNSSLLNSASTRIAEVHHSAIINQVKSNTNLFMKSSKLFASSFS